MSDERRLRSVPRPPPTRAAPPRRPGPPPPTLQRHAAIVAIDAALPAGDRDPDAASTAVAARLDEAARILVSHGGQPIDRAGTMLLAGFGVPQALERAAHRAVLAARDACARGLGGAGVESGVVVAALASDGTIVALRGDAVEEARRLGIGAATGTVRVGPHVHAETVHLCVYRRPSDDAWELEIGGDEPTLPAAPLIGRDAELARLVGVLERGRDERGAWIDVVGEAGVGKSRLADEAAFLARASGFTVVVGHASTLAGEANGDPFAEIVLRWAEITAADDETSRRAKLEHAVAQLRIEAASDLVTGLATLLGLPGEHDTSPGDARARLVQRSTQRLLELFASHAPLLVVVEDLHWLDASSLDLVAGAAAVTRASPVVLLTTRRPDGGTPADTAPDERIELGPLDPASASRLVRALLPPTAPAALAARIVERTAGNAFFIEEVARGVGAGGDADPEIPDTVEQLVLVRADSASAVARAVLELAAVVGPSADARLLLALLEGDSESVGALAELVARRLLGATTLTDDVRYAFPHVLACEAIYGAILPSRRRALHARVAAAVEAVYAARLGEHYATLAYHYGRAGRPAEAEDYLLRAGERAERTAASGTALHHFQEATRLYLERGGQAGAHRARLHRHVGIALFNRGRLLEARDEFTRALACQSERFPATRLGLAATLPRSLAALLWQLYGPARRRPPATDRDRTIFELMFLRQQAQITTDPARLLFDGLDALRRVGRVDPATVPVAASMLTAAAGVFSYGGVSFGVSNRLLARAAALAAPDDPVEACRVRGMQYVNDVLAGAWGAAQELEDALVQENVRRGRLWEVVTYLGIATERAIHEGHFTLARTRIARLAEIEDAFEFDLARSNRQAMTALLHLERGDLSAAREAAHRYLADHRDDLLNLYAVGILAKVRLLAGEVDAAAALVAQGVEIARRAAPVPPFHASCHARSALLLAVTAADGGGRRAARRALGLTRWVAWHRPEVLRLAGTLAWQHGRRRTALRRWRRAIAEARRLGTWPEQARVFDEAGARIGADAHMRLDGLDAAACVARAAALRSEGAVLARRT